MAESESELKQPILLAPLPVIVLIALLLGVHGILVLGGPQWQDWAFYVAAFNPANYGPAAGSMVPGSDIWSFLTYAFLHGSWSHVIFNSLWLLVFGTPVARQLGTTRFLILQAVAAIAGASIMLLIHWGENTIVIGASAAVTGLFAAAVPIMYGHIETDGQRVRHIPLSPLELLRSRRAMGFMAVLLAIMLATGVVGFTGTAFVENGAIAWEAHLAGFAAGLVTFYLLGGARTGEHGRVPER